ncbi:phosphoribosyltransferase [Candidatus Gottesmanbacteria bacterium]|nr:phosphoribosyltransferase [Candidatus Gottesmanbacteria bacterium]
MSIEYLPVSWQQYHAYAQQLAEEILTKDGPVDEIVAISRGGLTSGHLLSDLLRIPISTFSIQSYTDIQKQGEVTITAGLQTSIEGKLVLLVDDVSDTGKTLVRALEYLKDFKPKKITTATMFYKPHSVFKPDFYAQETSRWILFPYEPTEMISLIFTAKKKEGKSEKEITAFLKSLNYTPERISFVRRFHVK